MPDQPKLLSIVIPTRDRADTLRYCIKTVLDIECETFELIICDNSPNDETYHIVNSIHDDRIIYVRTPALLSMTENWNYAFQHVSGNFTMYIGDDDGIFLPGLMNLIEKIRENNFLAYKWFTSEYQWPIDDYPSKIISLATHKFESQVCNLNSQAKTVMKMGGWRYYHLPGVYHGAISTKVLHQIKCKNGGKLFNTTQPDLFTAVSIPEFVNEYMRIGVPATIQGRSAKSNGGSSVSKDGKKNVARYMSEFGNYQFDEEAISLPGEMSWFMEPFVIASKKYKVYADSPLDASAMWAFATRIGFVSYWAVTRYFGSTVKDSKLKFVAFTYWYLVHTIIAARRILLNTISSLTRSKRKDPIGNDIYEFSHYVRKLYPNNY